MVTRCAGAALEPGTSAAAGVPRPRGGVPAPGTCDALEVPAAAGAEVLARGLRTGPVAAAGGLMRFLIAPGAAADVPGLLCWLEWGGVPLELRGLELAPRDAWTAAWGGVWARAAWPRAADPDAMAGLPAVRMGGGGAHGGGRGGAPDLVRLVGAAATACHRLALRA